LFWSKYFFGGVGAYFSSVRAKQHIRIQKGTSLWLNVRLLVGQEPAEDCLLTTLYGWNLSLNSDKTLLLDGLSILKQEILLIILL